MTFVRNTLFSNFIIAKFSRHMIQCMILFVEEVYRVHKWSE